MALFTNLFAYQPLKTLYVVSALFFNASRLPFWILKYTFVRQHPTWSFRKALSLRIARAFLHTVSAIRAHTPLPLTPGKEGDRFVVIRKREEDGGRFKGPMLANALTVQPVDIGGVWYPRPLTAQDVAKEDLLVILHIHGGAYVIGDGRTEYSGYLANSLLKGTPATHILVPSYRLSTLPAGPSSNPFPAALQDTLTSYLYLLHELHIPASKIVLSGDSAGANCAIALLRYIAEYGAELDTPNPGAALLWSPWIDPTSGDLSFESTNPHFSSDYITANFIAWGMSALAGQNAPLSGPSVLARNPYVNAKVGGFKTPVPIFVNLGSTEVLFFDGKDWYEMMRKEGNDVHLDIQKGVCHDILLVAGMVGMTEEAAKMGKRAGEWLKGVRE